MLKARGVDFIKIQSGVPREAYFAIADEAKKDGIESRVTYLTPSVRPRRSRPDSGRSSI